MHSPVPTVKVWTRDVHGTVFKNPTVHSRKNSHESHHFHRSNPVCFHGGYFCLIFQGYVFYNKLIFKTKFHSTISPQTQANTILENNVIMESLGRILGVQPVLGVIIVCAFTFT